MAHSTEFAVLDYLLKHPSAQDTLQGIAEWWILRDEIDRQVEKVAGVLDSLVSKGLLTVGKTSGTAGYYRLNTEKLPEIQSLLQTHMSRDPR
jgi:hypothetical protein